jgi:SAM-dependent methyltransferase
MDQVSAAVSEIRKNLRAKIDRVNAAVSEIRKHLRNECNRVTSPGIYDGPMLHNLLCVIQPADEFELLAPPSQHKGQEVHTSFDMFDEKPDFDALAAMDTYPLPVTEDREGYHGERHLDYWMSGLKDYMMIKELLGRYSLQLPAPVSIFDMGCASGRVLRHFMIREKNAELWAVDINVRHVEWVRRHLDSSVKVFHGTVMPSLPIADNSFSLIYAFSVFTHIDLLESAWLLELRRVLRPGGIAYLTIHSDKTWKNLNPNWGIYKSLLEGSARIREYAVTEEFLKGPMPKEKTVFTYNASSPTFTNVFHHSDYVRNQWGRYFEIIDIVEAAHDYQDVVLLRKR